MCKSRASVAQGEREKEKKKKQLICARVESCGERAVHASSTAGISTAMPMVPKTRSINAMATVSLGRTMHSWVLGLDSAVPQPPGHAGKTQ
jgi:hypothetical protein